MKGKLIIFSAPSGAGKSTIVKHLIDHSGIDFGFSISATSRAPRGTEKHGVEYFFISPEEFRKRNGSMICAELLGLKKPEGSSMPEARTEQYYAKRPCAKMVEEAAAIWAEYLEKQRK